MVCVGKTVALAFFYAPVANELKHGRILLRVQKYQNHDAFRITLAFASYDIKPNETASKWPI
jgi:hypothetical protein